MTGDKWCSSYSNNEYAMLQKKNDVGEVNLDYKKRLEVYSKFVRVIFALKHKKRIMEENLVISKGCILAKSSIHDLYRRD